MAGQDTADAGEGCAVNWDEWSADHPDTMHRGGGGGLSRFVEDSAEVVRHGSTDDGWHSRGGRPPQWHRFRIPQIIDMRKLLAQKNRRMNLADQFMGTASSAPFPGASPGCPRIPHFVWATDREAIEREMSAFVRPAVWIYREGEVVTQELEHAFKVLEWAVREDGARHVQVVAMMRQGLGTKAIAESLRVDERTIRRDKEQILFKAKELERKHYMQKVEYDELLAFVAEKFPGYLKAAEAAGLTREEIALDMEGMRHPAAAWTPAPVPDVPEPKEDGPAKKEWGCTFIGRVSPVRHGAGYERNLAALNAAARAVRPEG